MQRPEAEKWPSFPLGRENSDYPKIFRIIEFFVNFSGIYTWRPLDTQVKILHMLREVLNGDIIYCSRKMKSMYQSEFYKPQM